MVGKAGARPGQGPKKRRGVVIPVRHGRQLHGRQRPAGRGCEPHPAETSKQLSTPTTCSILPAALMPGASRTICYRSGLSTAACGTYATCNCSAGPGAYRVARPLDSSTIARSRCLSRNISRPSPVERWYSRASTGDDSPWTSQEPGGASGKAKPRGPVTNRERRNLRPLLRREIVHGIDQA